MATVSLCMIVKNEEAVLRRCLDCVADIVDEIVVVDTGSVDKTKEIAESCRCRVFDYKWEDDFAAARNFAFSKGTKDFLFWLDADDVMDEENRRAFLEMKDQLDQSTDIVMLKYDTAFDESGRCIFSCCRERLVKNDGSHKWQGAVHEAIPLAGNLLYKDIHIQHRKIKQGEPGRNLRIYEKLLEKKKELGPREQYYYARELYDAGRWKDAAAVFQKFIEEPLGWMEDKIEACRLLSLCFGRLGENKMQLEALWNSFQYDVPRAEICCTLGSFFYEEQKYEQAAYWYERALNCTREEKRGGFVQEDCYGYLPSLMLCVCYYRLGDREKSQWYHRLSGLYKPNGKEYLSNCQFFPEEPIDADGKTEIG
ncbi:MAG: glycosyltransferase [Blautia sp.]|jgi:glycosyltransferase involved in cell wall biosynthesis